MHLYFTNLSRLGSTVFTTLAYRSIARTHKHIDLHALEVFSTVSGTNRGFSTYFFNFFKMDSDMLSLSYSIIFFINPGSPSSVFALGQSGRTLNSRHIASITVSTRSGGLLNTRTSAISFFSSASKA